jgi:AraC family transcriptional regulator, L-rhamnose operon transcriptional activator RhaR
MKAINIKKLNHFPEGSLPIRLLRINQQETMDFHDHAFHELVIILNGEGEHVAGDERYKISAGDVFLLKPGTAHGYRDTLGLELVNVLYLPEKLNLPLYDLANSPGYHAFFDLEPAMRAQHGFRSKLQVSNKQLDSLKALVKKLEHEESIKSPGRLFRMAAILMQLIGQVSEYYSGTDAPNRAEVLRLGKVISYIETRYAKPLSLDALAKRAAMSPSTLHRAFTSSMGESPINYLITVRLDRAKELLKDTNLSITEISSRVGFRDSNYFSRIFKKKQGKSPREFR